MVKITILNSITPSLNKTMKMHWATRKKLKDIWYCLIKFNSNGVVWNRLKPSKYKVTIIRYSPRLLDYDNFVGGVKETIIDNIKCKVLRRIPMGYKLNGKPRYSLKPFVTAGLIYDDDDGLLKTEYRQIKTNTKHKKMEIIVEKDGG